MSEFILELREPPAQPRRKGCVISTITAIGVLGIGTLILLPAINSSRNAAMMSQMT